MGLYFKLRRLLMLEISPTGQILIVGSRPSNFGREFLESKRLVFWHSTDNRSLSRLTLPKRVEAIIFTRFISHSLQQKIMNMARVAGIKFFRFVRGTGEIKKMIGESGILNQEMPESPVLTSGEMIEVTTAMPVPQVLPQAQEVEESLTKEGKEEKMEKPKIGFLTEFVLKNANFSANAGEEIKRLFNLAISQGLKTTERSVEFCFYQNRKRLRQQAVTEKTAQPSIPKKPLKRKKDSLVAIEKWLTTADIIAVAMREIIEENKYLRAEVKSLRRKLTEIKSVLKANS